MHRSWHPPHTGADRDIGRMRTLIHPHTHTCSQRMEFKGIVTHIGQTIGLYCWQIAHLDTGGRSYMTFIMHKSMLFKSLAHSGYVGCSWMNRLAHKCEKHFNQPPSSQTQLHTHTRSISSITIIFLAVELKKPLQHTVGDSENSTGYVTGLRHRLWGKPKRSQE